MIRSKMSRRDFLIWMKKCELSIFNREKLEVTAAAVAGDRQPDSCDSNAVCCVWFRRSENRATLVATCERVIYISLAFPSSQLSVTWTLLHDDVRRQDTENKKRQLFRQTSQESLILCKDTEETRKERVREIRRFDCVERRNPDFSPLLFLRTRDMSYAVRDMSSNSE